MPFFTRNAESYEPLSHAASQWSSEAINGAAVAGLGAYAAETAHGDAGFVPARFTIDLFRQPKFQPLTVRAERVRDGRTIRVTDVRIEQAEKLVARASVVLVRRTADPPGTRWQANESPQYPPPHLLASIARPGIYWGSDGYADSWSSSMSGHQNAGRKRLWIDQTDLLAGEQTSPFVRAATVGELTNTLTSWGDSGIGFINHDFTMVMARVPNGSAIGIEAELHMSDSGIAVGAASMFDRQGRFAVCSVSSVAHAVSSLDVSTTSDDWGNHRSSGAERMEVINDRNTVGS
ncbi:acyl-CoA thioesterase domain-containing protein [Nocardia rhizosphaerihabitans]|uniref:Thioesterase n=1 Tax=Nocardia rhizosphaerihabitans TaxID=1691570 RepID=A0ABQ2K827_9NOCA|nr:acyl-CoA thioesterase domain-containing protein [Nocardia rhizosphaerihabitans]GGN72015.1 hypothetical protein GCM10011610_12920 [Nocardia rhizosphaerihabitans]